MITYILVDKKRKIVGASLGDRSFLEPCPDDCTIEETEGQVTLGATAPALDDRQSILARFRAHTGPPLKLFVYVLCERLEGFASFKHTLIRAVNTEDAYGQGMRKVRPTEPGGGINNYAFETVDTVQELRGLANFIRTPGTIDPEDPIDCCARLIENRARALEARECC